MKIVSIGGTAKTSDLVNEALYLRWPKLVPLAAPNGIEGLRLISNESPDLALLYPRFSDLSLSDFLDEARQLSNVPLLVLGHKCDETELITALQLGADDYVRLPCDPTELMIRMRSLLRRSSINGSKAQPPLIVGDLTIDSGIHDVLIRGLRSNLTVTEFRLLYLLVQNREQVVPYRDIEGIICGAEEDRIGRAKKHIQSLRKKLGDSPTTPVWIESVLGVGYRFIGRETTVDVEVGSVG